MESISRLEANGVDFAYLEDGPAGGPLALCLHGFPDHAPTWAGLVADLATAGFHAVAPWMRGYAPTAVPADGRYQVGALAADALALVGALAGDGPAVLVGHDWGAMAAHTAAAHRPERFTRLVFMSVPHPVSLMGRFLLSPRQLQRSWYQFFFLLPFAGGSVSANDFALIDALWRDWSPGYGAPESYMRALKDTLGASGTLEAALGYYRHLWNPDLHDPALAAVQAAQMAPVPVPSLYLHGEDDGCIGIDMVAAETMAPMFPAGLEVEIVPGAGHFLHLERPEVINPRIVKFLS
jgi:pimeloyl-ACP methyl ester carboxylesterase